MTVLFAFLHHLAAFTLVAALAIELVLLRQELTAPTVRKLQAVDAVLGVAAVILLVVGMLRVFYFEKGAAYYFTNHAFLMKIAAFIIIALVAIIPTREFLKWLAAVRAGEVLAVDAKRLRLVRTIVHIELAGVVIILLGAAIMAKGGWM